MITRRTALGLLAASVALPRQAFAVSEPPLLEDQVASGALPPMADRLPRNPRVMPLAAMGRKTGSHGGQIRILIGGQRDIRLMPINGYSRLVGYDERLNLQPDILASVDGRG